MFTIICSYISLKHIKCIKYINLYLFRAFIGPSSGGTKICEIVNCTSTRQMLRWINLNFLPRVSSWVTCFLCHLSYVYVVTVQFSFECLFFVTFSDISLLLFSLAVSWFPYWCGSSLCSVIVDSVVTERWAGALWAIGVDVSCIRVSTGALADYKFIINKEFN
jgi:hypothetical protein